MAQVTVRAQLVVPSTGQRFDVDGRVAALLALLAANAAKINGLAFCRIAADATPNKVHLSITETLLPVRVGDADLTAPRDHRPVSEAAR